MRKEIQGFLIILGLLAAGQVWSADQGEGPVVRVDYFGWEEFDADGSRLLHELGPRIGVGVEGDDFLRALPGFVYRFSGLGYVGSVDYSGQTQEKDPATGKGFPISLTTDYLGLNMEAMGGQRYGYMMESYQMDLLFGASMDLWIRNLRDTHTAAGKSVAGYRETYLVWTAKAAMGLSHQIGRGSGYLLAGVKYPFYASEWPTFADIELHPKGRLRTFLRWTVTDLLPFQRTGIGVSLFYDSFRFAASDAESVGGKFWLQPKSSMDVVGIEIAIQ